MTHTVDNQIVTANHLLSGEVVYLRADNSWSNAHSEAEVLTDKEAADARLRDAKKQGDVVISPYLAGTAMNEIGKPVPNVLRERLRTRGPTNRFHGKQVG